MKEDKTIVRITLIGILIAVLFGVLQYIPSESKWEFFDINGLLFVFSKVFFAIPLLFFILYVIFLLVENSATFTLKKNLSDTLYDMGVIITICIFYMVIGSTTVINLINFYPSFFTDHAWIGIVLLLFPLVSGVLFCYILGSRIFDKLKPFKWFDRLF